MTQIEQLLDETHKLKEVGEQLTKGINHQDAKILLKMMLAIINVQIATIEQVIIKQEKDDTKES